MNFLLRLSLLLLIMTIPIISSANAIYPPALKKGDKIAIVAPGWKANKTNVDLSAEVLKNLGYKPVIYKTAHGDLGNYGGTKEERLADLRNAFLDPDIRVILCARGGFGLVHLLDSLATLPIEKDPKWVVGFSDISALHALMASKGIASIHASMVLEVARGIGELENQRLLDIMHGKFPEYKFESDSRNRHGEAEGRLVGGNLSVLQALIDTPYDIFKPGTILFIEDVGEPIYKIERIFYQLKMKGVLSNIHGLVVGSFRKYEDDPDYPTMEDMMADVLKDYPELPVAYNAPIGHIRHNQPVVELSKARLSVRPDGVTLTMIPE